MRHRSMRQAFLSVKPRLVLHRRSHCPNRNGAQKRKLVEDPLKSKANGALNMIRADAKKAANARTGDSDLRHPDA